MSNTDSRPFSLRIFCPGGDPDGLKIVEKSNWSGCGLVFPRALLAAARARAELDRTGVYILIGPPEESGLPRVYVGEGDPIRPRIDRHASEKDFWTIAVTFTSKDGNLNKAHVQHLESRLVALAGRAKRCVLDNGTEPALPSLSEPDAGDAEGFLAELLLCLPALGVGVFDVAAAPAATTQATAPLATPRMARTPQFAGRVELRLRRKPRGAEATGFETSQGFLVREGSRAAVEAVESIEQSPHLVELRKALVANGVMKQEGSTYRFTQDYVFSSPSAAAGVVIGGSANGRTAWVDAAGRTLKEIQAAEAAPGEGGA